MQRDICASFLAPRDVNSYGYSDDRLCGTGCGSRADIGEKYVLLSEVSQEWLQQRTVEQIIDVPVQQVVTVIAEVVLVIFTEAHLGAYRRTDRQKANASNCKKKSSW